VTRASARRVYRFVDVAASGFVSSEAALVGIEALRLALLAQLGEAPLAHPGPALQLGGAQVSMGPRMATAARPRRESGRPARNWR
jgi:hypothetical protein